MPTLSRWAIKLALVHFTGGVLLGALMLAGKAGYWPIDILGHRLVHIHMLFFGWLVQLVFGVAYWLLPTFLSGDRRGRSGLAVASIVVVNLGAILGTGAPWVPILGGVGWGLETLACLLFVVHAWPRIKSGR